MRLRQPAVDGRHRRCGICAANDGGGRPSDVLRLPVDLREDPVRPLLYLRLLLLLPGGGDGQGAHRGQGAVARGTAAAHATLASALQVTNNEIIA